MLYANLFEEVLEHKKHLSYVTANGKHINESLTYFTIVEGLLHTVQSAVVGQA